MEQQAVAIDSRETILALSEGWARHHIALVKTLEKRTSAFKDAESKARGLRIALDQGDDSISPAKLNNADAALEVAKRLRDAADRDVARSQRRKPVVPSLAWVIEPILADHLKGRIPVHVVIGAGVPSSAETIESAYGLPCIVLSQAKPTERDVQAGSVRGEVEVEYHKTDLHADLDADKLAAALEGSGVRGPVRSNGNFADNGLDTQSLTIHVVSGFEPVPVIASSEVAGHRVNTLVQGIATRTERAGWRYGWGESQASPFGFSLGAKATAVDAPVVSLGDGGERIVAVKVEVSAWPLRPMGGGDGRLSLNEVGHLVVQQLNQCDETPVAGLGRCASIQMASSGIADTPNGRVWGTQAVLTFRSRTSPDITE